MASPWKSAGISYLKYAQICATAVRNSLKEDVRAAAQRRDANGLKVSQWANGKAGEQKFIVPPKQQ
ncbi:hypothetical protein Unana1_00216 [Umbelopsis nana]